MSFSILQWGGSALLRPKILLLWLGVLTWGVIQTGEKVFIERTAEITRVETKVDMMLERLNSIDKKLDKNAERLMAIIGEQAAVREQLKIHEDASKRAKR